jgi:hypothetical protein
MSAHVGSNTVVSILLSYLMTMSATTTWQDNEFILEKDAFQHLLRAMLDRDNTGKGEFPILITRELKPWDSYSLFRDYGCVDAFHWKEYSTNGKSMMALADAALGN